MKKIIIILLVTLLLLRLSCSDCSAQIPDPIVQLNTGKTAAQALATVQQLAAQAKRLEELQNELKAVSGAIKAYKRVNQVREMAITLAATYRQFDKTIKADGNFHPAEAMVIVTGFSEILGEANALLDMLKMAAEDGLKLNNKERLDKIDQAFAEMQRIKGLLDAYRSYFYTLSYYRSRAQAEKARLEWIYGRKF